MTLQFSDRNLRRAFEIIESSLVNINEYRLDQEVTDGHDITQHLMMNAYFGPDFRMEDDDTMIGNYYRIGKLQPVTPENSVVNSSESTWFPSFSLKDSLTVYLDLETGNVALAPYMTDATNIVGNVFARRTYHVEQLTFGDVQPMFSRLDLEDQFFGRVVHRLYEGFWKAEMMGKVTTLGSKFRDNRDEIYIVAGHAWYVSETAEYLESLEGKVPPRYGDLYEDLLETFRFFDSIQEVIREYIARGSDERWREICKLVEYLEPRRVRMMQKRMNDRYREIVNNQKNYPAYTGLYWECPSPSEDSRVRVRPREEQGYRP